MEVRTDGTHPNLTTAIAKAMAAAVSMQKNKTNTYSKYDYTSSEVVINVARQLLAAQGVAVIPLGYVTGTIEHDVIRSGGRDRDDQVFRIAEPTVGRMLRLAHVSGEELEVTGPPWPVISGKTPLDKAMHGALTTSLRAYLRDLLLLDVEGGEDEADQRDDSSHQQDQQQHQRGRQGGYRPEAERQDARRQGGGDNWSKDRNQRERDGDAAQARQNREAADAKVREEQDLQEAGRLVEQLPKALQDTVNWKGIRESNDLPGLITWAKGEIDKAKREHQQERSDRAQDAFA